MSKYKNYIIGIVLIASGIALGWFIKPSTQAPMQDHSAHVGDAGAMNTTTPEKEEIWTCSMHPQIRQNEPGLCPICEMDLIPLDNSMSNDDPAILQMSNAAAKLAQVETTMVGQSSQGSGEQSSVKVDGTIELDERSINVQSTHLGGRIEDLLVNFEGEYVSAGQHIATVFSTELLNASQELITAAKFENRVPGIKESSIQKLKNWKITDKQIDDILTSGKPMETINIYADHSGYILKRKASQGDYVKQGQTLYTVGQTGWLWLIFNVFESDLADIRKGQNVEFTTPSLNNEKFTARISYIDPLLNSTNRTGIIRAEIANKKNLLKPGMLIKGEIKVRSSDRKNTNLSIPKTALLWTGDKSVVYVQMPDTDIPSYHFREVTVGNQSGEMVSIIEGLENGEMVVTNGAFAIDAAAQLNNNFSMMNRNISIKKEGGGDQVPNFTAETPDEFKDQLDNLVLSYIDLKDGLVLTDSKAGSLAASKVLDKLEMVDMSLLKGDAHMYWMEQLEAIKAHTTKIKEVEDVEDQRNQFDFLSQAIINSLKSFGTNESTYYVMYCPMAKNNQGADWLAVEKEIRNPYFGDKMMKCGSVKIELNKDYVSANTMTRPKPAPSAHNH